MGGFTAINTSALPELPERPIQDAAASVKASAPHRRRRDTASVVSEYLGIGKDAKRTLPAVTTHLHKATTKGKKRTSIASESKESKRRKSNTTITAPVTKAGQPLSVKHATQFVGADQTSRAQSTRSARKRRKVSSPINDVADVTLECNQHALDSISVYAPKTSMDVFDSTSIRTSVDSVKAGGNLGCTLYQRAPSSDSMPNVVDFSTPLLPLASIQGIHGSGNNDYESSLDETALVDLAMAIEDDSVDDEEVNHRPKTPPPRSHKQNMRDVDEHEDYGGALLSYAERQLLGEHYIPYNSAEYNGPLMTRP